MLSVQTKFSSIRCTPAGGAGAARSSFVSSELVEPDVTGTIEPVVGAGAIRSAMPSPVAQSRPGAVNWIVLGKFEALDGSVGAGPSGLAPGGLDWSDGPSSTTLRRPWGLCCGHESNDTHAKVWVRTRLGRAGSACRPGCRRHLLRYGRLLRRWVRSRYERAVVARALRSYWRNIDDVVVVTKVGHLRVSDARWGVDCRPSHLKRAAQHSLRRLGLEAHPLLQLHRPDPTVPFVESVGAFKGLIEDGLALRVGLCNVNVTQLDLARSVLGDSLVSVQNRMTVGDPGDDTGSSLRTARLGVSAAGTLGRSRTRSTPGRAKRPWSRPLRPCGA